MKRFVIAGVLTAAAVAFAAPARFDLKGDAKKGEITFKQFCVPCHGDNGKGDGPAGVALNPKPANFVDPERAAKSTDEQISLKIKEGGVPFNMSPLMVSWKATLNDMQIRDVAAYIRAFSRKPADAGVKTPDAGVRTPDAGVKAPAADAGAKAPAPPKK